ncbi:MAG: KpsF/GutQ family sugar-phosphate isomerase [Candidatus Omnitrophica bacterium]|nr:KpsF/GutQ family sugar-phosphate isomerase [Candidatus Omnitrophota bacterium]
MTSPVLKHAKKVLKVERDALDLLLRRVDRRFEKAVELLKRCEGRVVVTGMGKPGIIGQKISATLSSLGVPSLWLHPAEAAHGDLGKVTPQDVVIALSHSGETDEVLHLLPVLNRLGAKLIAITANAHSRLARSSDVAIPTYVKDEASSWGLVPTASTTAMLALGDALALELARQKGFTATDFAQLHPGGSLGKQLTLRVEDLMRRGASNPVVSSGATVKKVLLAITRARAGSAAVVDAKGRLIGIFTDGDLRRRIETDPQILKRKVSVCMTRAPKTLPVGHLAVEALKILRSHKIDEIPIVDAKGAPAGLLDVQDLLKAGLV